VIKAEQSRKKYLAEKSSIGYIDENRLYDD
jgi:hypothetical protein